MLSLSRIQKGLILNDWTSARACRLIDEQVGGVDDAVDGLAMCLDQSLVGAVGVRVADCWHGLCTLVQVQLVILLIFKHILLLIICLDSGFKHLGYSCKFCSLSIVRVSRFKAMGLSIGDWFVQFVYFCQKVLSLFLFA